MMSIQAQAEHCVQGSLPTLLSSRSQGMIDESKACAPVTHPSHRVAIVTIPLAGHKRVAIALAEEMCQRGYAVDFLIGADGITSELRDMSLDFPFFTLHPVSEGASTAKMDWGAVASSTGRLGGSKRALVEAVVARSKNEQEQQAMVEQWKTMRDILSQVHPDVILFDHSLQVVQAWAEQAAIPSIIMHTPYFMTGEPAGCARLSLMDKMSLTWTFMTAQPMAFINEGKKELGISGGGPAKIREGAAGARQGAGNAPHTLVFCEPELLNSARLPERAHVVGPCLASEVASVDAQLLHWLEEASEQNQRVLYVALGTLANDFLTAEAIGTLLDAFNSLGAQWRVLWSLPAAQQELLSQTGRPCRPEQIRFETFVAQRGVLAHPAVALFLTHGGQNSVNEGLAAGRPLLCMPLFCDQYEVAQAVLSHGLGLVFHKDELLAGRTDRLLELAQRLTTEGHFLETVSRHAKLLRLRAGCGRAAELIESVVHAGTDFQELWRPRHLDSTQDASSCFVGLAKLCAAAHVCPCSEA